MDDITHEKIAHESQRLFDVAVENKTKYSLDLGGLYDYLTSIQRDNEDLLYRTFWHIYSNLLATEKRSPILSPIAELITKSNTPRATRFAGMLLIDSKELVSRDFVAEWMSEVGDPDGIPFLEVAATNVNNSHEVRSRACYALGCTKDERAIPILLKILENNESSNGADYEATIINEYALRGLAQIDTSEVRKILTSFAESTHPRNVRRTALNELSRLNMDADVSSLMQKLTIDSDNEIAELAQQILAKQAE